MAGIMPNASNSTPSRRMVERFAGHLAHLLNTAADRGSNLAELELRLEKSLGKGGATHR